METLNKREILFQLNNMQATPQIPWKQYHIIREVYIIIKYSIWVEQKKLN